MKKTAIVGIIGALLGIIGSRILFVGSALSLIPWGLVGLADGIYAKNTKEAVVSGFVYGFLLSFVFMLSGYNGTQSIITRVPFFAILGLFGAFCGLILAYIGFFIKNKLKLRDL